MGEVEPVRMVLRSGKQALQAAPKGGSLADVGLGVGVRAAQKKHGRGGSYDGEDVAVTFRAELDAFSQHKAIVVRPTSEMQAPLVRSVIPSAVPSECEGKSRDLVSALPCLTRMEL